CHERWVHVEPYPEHVIPLDNLRFAAEYLGDNLLFPPYNNVSNIYDAGDLLNSEGYNGVFQTYRYPVFPKNLPPVPKRADIILKTDEPVPCDGIWEPVKVLYNHKFLIVKDGINGFKNLGAYNYFIQGMKPPLQYYHNMLLSEGWGYRDIHWRLVWEDTRYCDGIIPDESEYFLDEMQGKRIQCRTGEQCPHSGQWATLAGGHQQFVYVRSGDKMPEAKVFKGGYSTDTYTPASWSLLDRDDGGSVFETHSGARH
ncbi:TPA: hypothetical protein JG914_004719, partial [Enterobacter hormaechei subsp. steigerwaltii]|nr:hypothetical protein [Enterobacter hormaechei subsp. steigerwaltii]